MQTMQRIKTVVGILFLSLFLFPVMGNAQAATVTIGWDAYPVDQIPLIQGFNLYRSNTPCAVAPVPMPNKVASIAIPTAVVMAETFIFNGTVCYEMTAFGPGGESLRSNRAEGVVKSLPNKPGNVRITVTVTP